LPEGWNFGGGVLQLAVEVKKATAKKRASSSGGFRKLGAAPSCFSKWSISSFCKDSGSRMADAAHEACVMRGLSTFLQIYVYRGSVDFRKAINGLSEIVESELKMKPFSGALFLFMHRRKDRVKILYWDKSGFALWYKRLEEAKFCWPKGEFTEPVFKITHEQLEWLLSGVDIWKIKTHKALDYKQIT
jgi:transposase